MTDVEVIEAMELLAVELQLSQAVSVFPALTRKVSDQFALGDKILAHVDARTVVVVDALPSTESVFVQQLSTNDDFAHRFLSQR